MSLVIFDTETGGLLEHHPTIQVAAVAVDAEWNEVATFERKLRFDLNAADPAALRMNSYSADVWAEHAIDVEQAWLEFAAFLKRHSDLTKTSRNGKSYTVARLCGHNAASFDLPRVSGHFRALNIFFPGDFAVLDTLRLFHWLCHFRGYPGSGRLADVAEYLGVEVADAHDALGDCRITAKIAPKLIEELKTHLGPVAA